MDPTSTAQHSRQVREIEKWLNAIKETAVMLNGSGVPSDSLGVDGNYYLDTDTGDLYQKEGGTWL